MVRWHRLVTRWHVRVALDADVLQVDVGLAIAMVVGLDDGDGQPLDRHGDGEDRVRGVHISEVPITAIRIAEDREREDLRVPVAADELVANAIPRVQIRIEQSVAGKASRVKLWGPLSEARTWRGRISGAVEVANRSLNTRMAI